MAYCAAVGVPCEFQFKSPVSAVALPIQLPAMCLGRGRLDHLGGPLPPMWQDLMDFQLWPGPTSDIVARFGAKPAGGR